MIGPVSPAPKSLTRLRELLQEQRYRRAFLDADRRQNAMVAAVTSLGLYATARNDFLLLGGGWLLRVTLATKVLHAIAIAIGLALLFRTHTPRRHDQILAGINVATGVIFIETLLSRLPSGEVQGPVFGVGAVLCVLYFAQRGQLSQRVLLGLTITAAAIPLLWSPRAAVSAAARTTGTLALAVLSFVGMLSARSFEQQRRSRFLAERRERLTRQELRARNRELFLAKERAEAMSRARAAFLAAMSHEFRTPMNAVIGLSDLLLDGHLGGDDRAHVATIHDSARALLTLLNNILDFAKIDAGKVELTAAPLDLPALARSVVEMMRPMTKEKPVTLGVDLAEGLPVWVSGDAARLRQVLVNLVSNALKFTEEGEVRLRIAEGAAGAEGHAITFRVEDSGIGMEPEVLARLFRPFEQADTRITRRFGGTGLGLAISQQIVQAMGGAIQVESTPGRGSVFSFTVTLPAAAPRRVARRPVSARREGQRSLAVLLVDDNVVNQHVGRAMLARLGHAPDVASSGPEALEAVARKDYDVVLMDLRMPGMSGIEATRAIRERLGPQRAPQILAMTASVFEEDRQACLQAGMQGFVGKPIDLAELEAMLLRVDEGVASSRPSDLALRAAAERAG